MLYLEQSYLGVSKKEKKKKKSLPTNSIFFFAVQWETQVFFFFFGLTAYNVRFYSSYDKYNHKINRV